MADPLSMMAIATVASAGVSLVGGAVRAHGERQEGEAAKEAAYILADQEESQATQEFAASQREAQERMYEAELTLSSQRARAAASGGGGAETPTIVRLMSETAKRARYGAETELFVGAQRMDSMKRSARHRRRTGDASAMGGNYAAFGTVAESLGGAASSLYTGYRGGAFG